MSEANETATLLVGEEVEASVSEAIARLDEVVGLLGKWNRQPKLLREVEALRKKLEGLLETLKTRPRSQSGGIP